MNVLAKHSCRVMESFMVSTSFCNIFLTSWRSAARHLNQRDSSKAQKILQLIGLGVDMEWRATSWVPFAKNFERLKDYKEVHGTVAIPTEHCRYGNSIGLNLFLFHFKKHKCCY